MIRHELYEVVWFNGSAVSRAVDDVIYRCICLVVLQWKGEEFAQSTQNMPYTAKCRNVLKYFSWWLLKKVMPMHAVIAIKILNVLFEI